MPSHRPPGDADVDFLREENFRLAARLRHLTRRQALLEQRIQRVNRIGAVRFLRWLSRLDAQPPADSFQLAYRNWTQETALGRRLQASMNPPPPRDIAVLVDARQPDPARLDRFWVSLHGQTLPASQLLVSVEGAPPDWLTRRCAQFSATVVTGGWEAALAQCDREWTAVVSGDALLEPDALAEWSAAAGEDSAA